MLKSSLQTACLAVALVSAWGPSADAQVNSEIRWQSNLTSNVSHARLMLGGSGSGGNGGSANIWTEISMPGIGSGSWGSSLTVEQLGSSFALMGIYNGSGGERLMVSIGSLTVIYGQTFEAAFPGFSEPAILDQLRTGSPLATDFLISNFSLISSSLGSGSECAAFSIGEPVGFLTIDVGIPAPSALGLGTLLVLARRRRR